MCDFLLSIMLRSCTVCNKKSKKSKWKIRKDNRAWEGDYVCDFPVIHQIRAAWLVSPSLPITGGSNGDTLSSLSFFMIGGCNQHDDICLLKIVHQQGSLWPGPVTFMLGFVLVLSY